jgi:ATP-dependent exoDNAse (exonuclease V) beta subunit
VLGGRFEENKEQFMGDVEDERKLFYVAVTRAKQNLFLFYDFSKKELSRFVREAAESSYLRINKEDLDYLSPDRIKDKSMEFDKLDDDIDFEYDTYDNKRREMWEQVQEQKVYRDMVYTARKQLMDYYGTAMHAGMKMAGADLMRVKGMSDEDVLKEAKRNRLI